jgi:hypothetical protein
MRRSRLEKAALTLVRAAGPERTVIVGGLAVALHGYVRATDDIDILVQGPLSEVRERLAEHGIQAILRRGDVADGDFPCLKGSVDGIPFEVLPQLAAIDWEAAPSVKIGRVRVRIADLAGLLALKLRAQGPQDLLDAAVLILLHPEVRSVALDLALRYGVRERIESLLADRRVRRQTREQRRRRKSA